MTQADTPTPLPGPCPDLVALSHPAPWTVLVWVLSLLSAPSPDPSLILQDKVLRMLYVWALCRDQDELNPYAAWRLLDISASSTEQVL